MPRFRRLAAVGHGGMADLTVAAARGVGGSLKLLVLKELRPGLARDPEYRLMFQREARIAALLAHPNVVQTYEVGSEGGRPFIAMEFLEGQPLHRLVRAAARAPAGAAGGLTRAMHLWILAELLSGLDYVHELRDHDGRALALVHRDVSPDNVVITYEGQVKLVDFGIVRLGDDGHTTIGTFKGKASYASPEQVRGAAIDRRSDLFAVGVMLWEALARRRMWAGLDELAITRRLAAGEVPPLPAEADASPGLRALCAAALTVDPAGRPASAEALREALEAAAPELLAVRRRALGALVDRLFAGDRAALRGLIEAQIRRARAAPDALVVIDMSHGSGLNEQDHGDRIDPDEPTRPDRVAVVEETVDPGGPRRDGGAQEATWAGAGARPGRPAGARRLVGLAAASLIVGLAWTALRGPEGAPSADPAPRAPPAPAPRDAAALPTADACARPDRPIVELSGDIERASRLTCDKIYRLRWQTFVRPGASLTIEPGTVILGDRDTRGTLIVQPGARLLAEGTPERPIVFTSEAPEGEREAGDWGGLVLLGRAPTNLRGADGRPTTGRVEGIAVGGEYGGDDPEDSSGALRYVRVEYSGTELGPNNEINGVTFAGVGRGTRVDHVQVRHTADDCFEFFGGTVDAHHLICQDPGDDGFDWDLGYTGRLQFLLLRDGVDALDTTAGLEGDNDPSGSANAPRSAPTIYNATLCGRGRALDHEHYGVLVRHGSDLALGNAVIVGFEAALDLRDRGTRLDLRGGLWSFAGVATPLAFAEVAGAAGPLADDDDGVDEVALLRAAGVRVADPDLPACVDPAAGGRFKPRAPLRDGAVAPPDDGFFDADARYVGAFRDADDRWDDGWAAW